MSGLARNLRLLATILTLGTIRLPAVKRQARRLGSGLARRMLRLRARPYAAQGEPVALVIAPHQDDEVLGCGGLIARKRLEGFPVHVVFITDGAASHPDHPTLAKGDVAALRETEALSALRILGVETPAIHFLGAPDGTLAWQTPEQAAEVAGKLRELIARVKPDEIFAAYRKDGSSEHEAAFGLLSLALQGNARPVRLYEYPVWSWWNPALLVRPGFSARRVVRFDFKGYGFLKRDALAAYRSQFEPTPPWKTPLLSPDFTALFAKPEEFYFEI
ncbi:MAG: PIG-L family deacetylase [Opitutaceae bacterium]|jgi:LmbE family N-acetylglucosaminyl deacetylase